MYDWGFADGALMDTWQPSMHPMTPVDNVATHSFVIRNYLGVSELLFDKSVCLSLEYGE